MTIVPGDRDRTTIAGRRHAWDLVTHLVGREFRLRYRGAFLGWLWAVGQPISRLAVYTFVFTRVLPLDIPDYPVFLFAGLIAWNWFSSGLASATSSVVERADLLLRPALPRAAVPLTSVLTDGLDYLAALPVLVAFLVAGDGIPATALALPLVLGVQLLLTVGLGYLLCPLNVYLRDVRLLVELALLLGFFVTPVLYGSEVLVERYPLLFTLNPMAQLIDTYRDILIEGRLPAPAPFLVLTAFSAVLSMVGYLVYRAASPTFVDEL